MAGQTMQVKRCIITNKHYAIMTFHKYFYTVEVLNPVRSDLLVLLDR